MLNDVTSAIFSIQSKIISHAKYQENVICDQEKNQSKTTHNTGTVELAKRDFKRTNTYAL